MRCGISALSSEIRDAPYPTLPRTLTVSHCLRVSHSWNQCASCVCAGEPTGHGGSDGAPSLSTWLRLLTSLPDQDIVDYTSILQSQGGAGDMHSASQLLRRPGSEERGQVLRDCGIQDGHVDVLLACVDKYDEYVSWTPEDAPGSDAPATFFSAAVPPQATKVGRSSCCWPSHVLP